MGKIASAWRRNGWKGKYTGVEMAGRGSTGVTSGDYRRKDQAVTGLNQDYVYPWPQDNVKVLSILI